MHHPLLYEINTRCWLRELSEKQGWPVTLANVPASEFERWHRLGFTHIWLMGVWTTGPESRRHAFDNPQLLQVFSELLSDWTPEDVPGSPYAVMAYHVPEALGGDAALAEFRKRLHSHGLKLILDFIPNHFGLDHPWLLSRPGLFVQTDTEAPGTFTQRTKTGSHWFAHGRDPFFPPWTDTVQLDYRRLETHSAMAEILESIARRCDGVRCDMAMLVLNEVFEKTWADFPCLAHSATGEFWTEAIRAVKKAHPHFLLVAEVYWDLEPKLQALGFDYTYDKSFYDYLIRRDYPRLQQHLLQARAEYIRASAHFLENHDEPRIASLLSREEHQVAALLLLGTPGMRLIHEGQLAGEQRRIPVQLGRRPPGVNDAEIAALYERLFRTLQRTAVGTGKAVVLAAQPAWNDNRTSENIVVILWQGEAREFDLVVANLAPHQSQCYVPIPVAEIAQYNWELKDLLGTEIHQRRGDDLEVQGLYLDMPAHGAQLFQVRPL